MKREDYLDVSGSAFLRAMFENTQDGMLTMEEDEQFYPRTLVMDWDEAALEALITRFEHLSAALTRLGREHAYWEVSTKDMPGELLQVWNTYIVPYPDYDRDLDRLLSISTDAELGEPLTEEEQAMLDKENMWLRENALTRLPFNRCEPASMIQRAKRYEKLVSLHAPKVVCTQELQALAEEMAYYYCKKEQSHTCRCCGRVYDLEDTAGHVLGSICPVCYWEEDNSEEFAFSCANGISLAAYRKAYFNR